MSSWNEMNGIAGGNKRNMEPGIEDATGEKSLENKLQTAVWVARSLFDRGKTSGASANLSFRHGSMVYITASGTCFGTLKTDDFAAIPLTNVNPGGVDAEAAQKAGTAEEAAVRGTDGMTARKPSKEAPLHLAVYKKSPDIGAVIHTHSTYSVLWSFVAHTDATDCIPPHTPYLRMRLGTVGIIPYEKPGSTELFQTFEERVPLSDGFLLKQHGPVVPGRDLLDAFYNLEELEESAKIAWELAKQQAL